MKALAQDERIQNYTSPVTCPHCDNTGQIVYSVQEPPYGEEMAPCPWCERGYRLEFGMGKKDGVEYVNPRPQWGKDGFWRGRDIPEAPEHLRDDNPLPQRENSLRMQLLTLRHTQRQAGMGDDDPMLARPDIALSEANPYIRFDEVRKHLQRVTTAGAEL